MHATRSVVDIEELIEFVASECGTDLSKYRRSCLRRRVGLRMTTVECSDLEGYMEYLEGQPGEMKQLLDIVTIHVARSAEYGVTNGVDPVAAKTIQRRVVGVDFTANTLQFDRPVMFNYTAPFIGQSESGSAAVTLYAFVTNARHIGMILVLGSRGGILGSVAKALEFYEPKPIDDFESVWRYVWDAHVGYNIWEPNLFEVHFCAVTLPKAGGLITP